MNLIVDSQNQNCETLVLKENMPITLKKSKKGCCRICLFSEYDNENPLIAPCKCSGTVKYIHLECLRQWLKLKQSRVIYKYFIIFTYKTIECEICKTHIPTKLKLSNDYIDLLNFEKPDSPYIVFEQLNTSNEKDDMNIYIVKFVDKDSITLGRAVESDAKFNDISISRNHAVIRMLNDGFYISDSNSKFGTCVEISGLLPLLVYKPLGIQIGRFFTKLVLDSFCISKIICCCM